MDTWQLLIVGIAVHLVFFYSIFDIYFTSPVVHGMAPVSPTHRAPARRLVLFVADGLRADKLMEPDSDGRSRSPFLRNIIETTGAWGVSHTRVPTESRPGHVALIAGLYEDVSAVAKGWKENPVEFDSVFNQSTYTWSWGSPDILPMFSKGATGDHVFTDCYPPEFEDFAAENNSELDTWVFTKLKDFLSKAKDDKDLMKKLKQDKIVFFLHLLGLDTNGHSNKPYSTEYLENIGLVDAGIKEIVATLDDVYQHDGETAFVLTADHGMTNWGSHGAGHPSETLTPLVAWGAGVRGPRSQVGGQVYPDTFSKDWNLDHLRRTDVEQADIAALMSALLGVPYPMNSVGLLPVDYLGVGEGDKAEAMVANMEQILAQYEVKMELKKKTTLSMVFRPFSELTPAKIANIRRDIRRLIQSGLFDDAIQTCTEVMKTALKGLNYYQTYDRFFLGVSITFGYLGWMAYILTLTLEDYSGIVQSRVMLDDVNKSFWRSNRGIQFIAMTIGAVITVLLYVQSLPWTNYLYCLLPVILWRTVFMRSDVIRQTWLYLLSSREQWTYLLGLLACAGCLEIMVLGFFWRELLSVGLLSMGMFHWLFSPDVDKHCRWTWLGLCVILSIFPLLPVVGHATNYNLVILTGCLAVGLASSCVKMWANGAVVKPEVKYRYIFSLQIVLVALATVIVYMTSVSVTAKEGVPTSCQVVSWLLLGVSFLQPLAGPTDIRGRLLTLGLAFTAPYLLLSIAHEALFVISLCGLLYSWLHLECWIVSASSQSGSQHKTSIAVEKLKNQDFVIMPRLSGGQPRRVLVLGDVRRALFYIFLLLIGFFGTGNIASINSFDPTAVYCFLTVFNPFVMGALLLFKVLVPLLLVTCVFRAIHVVSRVPIRAFFLLVLIMTDTMALHFFFLVRDYGSWLDIGTSISHYVIVMCMIIFMMLLFGLSQILTTVHLIPWKKQH